MMSIYVVVYKFCTPFYVGHKGVLSLRPGLRWPSQKKVPGQGTWTRYLDKVPGQVKLIAGMDPFQLASNPDCGAATRDLPPVRASDIVSYLVLQTSFIIEYL